MFLNVFKKISIYCIFYLFFNFGLDIGAVIGLLGSYCFYLLLDMSLLKKTRPNKQTNSCQLLRKNV